MVKAVLIDANLAGTGSVTTEQGSAAPNMPNANAAGGADIVAGQNPIAPTVAVIKGREAEADYKDGLVKTADQLNIKTGDEVEAKKGGSKLTDEPAAMPVVVASGNGALDVLPNGNRQDPVNEGKGLLEMALGTGRADGVKAQLEKLHQMEGSLPLDGAGSKIVQTINEAEVAGNLTPRSVSKLTASVAELVDVQAANNQVVPPAFDLSRVAGLEKMKNMMGTMQDVPTGSDVTAMNIEGQAAANVNQFREQKAVEERERLNAHALPPLSNA